MEDIAADGDTRAADGGEAGMVGMSDSARAPIVG